jgi:hypothetical protein
MEPYHLDQLPPVSPAAHELATKIRGALRDREWQRRRTIECGEEVYIALVVQQWASSLARWIKSGDQRDRDPLRRGTGSSRRARLSPTGRANRATVVGFANRRHG